MVVEVSTDYNPYNDCNESTFDVGEVSPVLLLLILPSTAARLGRGVDRHKFYGFLAFLDRNGRGLDNTRIGISLYGFSEFSPLPPASGSLPGTPPEHPFK